MSEGDARDEAGDGDRADDDSADDHRAYGGLDEREADDEGAGDEAMTLRTGLSAPGHAAFDELTVGFALDALEPGEEELLLAHLSDCSRCQGSLAAHREVAASLAYALPQEPLPPMSPLLALAITSTPRSLPADPFPTLGIAPRPVVGGSHSFARSAHRSLGRRTRRVLVGAGALGIVAAVGLSGYDVHLRSNPARPSVASAQAALQAITERGVTIAHLSGTGSSATAVVAPDQHAYLVASGLPGTTGDRAYVVWNLTGAKPAAVQHFAVTHAATPAVVDLGVATSTAPQKYAVTLENTKVTSPLPSTPSGAYVLTEDDHPA